MKSQMAACRLAARRLDELFDKYGRDTMLAAIAQIFDETEQKCRNVVAQLPDGVYEAEASIDDDGVHQGRRGADPRQGHGQGRRHDHRPLRLLGRAQGRDQLAHLCRRARRLQGADRAARSGQRRLVPRAQGHHPRRQHHDGALSGADGGLERHRADRGRRHRRGARRRMPDRVPAGHHGLLGGAVVFFGTHPKTRRRFVVQSIEGGGWGGRPFEDGESGTVSVCQGDVRNGSIEGIELKCPVVVESRALRQDSCGAGKFRGGLGIDMRVRNLVEGRWNFEMPRRGKCPPWGLWGGTPGEPGGYLLKRPGETRLHDDGGQPSAGGDRRRGHRAHRRRRRLGRSAGARPGAGRRGRGGGADLGRRGAQALRRGAPRQHVAGRKRDPRGCENG